MLNRRSLIGSAGFPFFLPIGLARANEVEETYSPGAVREDLDMIWAALSEVSPEPFMTVPESQIFSTYRRVRESITSPMSVRSAWLAIAPVLGALNDGHVALGFPEELNKVPRRFPLRFRVSNVGDLLLVKSDRTGTIAQGSRIVSIEDVPAADYLRTTVRRCRAL